MKKINVLLCIALFISMFSACINPPDYPIEPEIEYISMSKNVLTQGFLSDTTIITFAFTDGDGNLGSDSIQNVFILDNRTGNIESYIIPVIPPQGNNLGISGEVSIDFFSTCCIPPDQPQPCQASTTYPTETITLDIYIEDQAGNKSNTITTEEILLRCN